MTKRWFPGIGYSLLAGYCAAPALLGLLCFPKLPYNQLKSVVYNYYQTGNN